MNTEIRLSQLEREIQALKSYSAPVLGQLRYPDTAPTASYHGQIDTSLQQLIIARLEATFTRGDGNTESPLVDFAFNMHVSPTFADYMASIGITVTGNDTTAYEDFYINGYITSVGPGSITFAIEVKNAIAPWGTATKNLDVDVQAISTVAGTLTLTRTI